MELGARLKQMRKSRGWSVRHMVVHYGFHVTQWQSFEKGKWVTIPTLLRICEAFQVRLEALVEGLGIEDGSAVSDGGGDTQEEPLEVSSAPAVPPRNAKLAQGPRSNS